MDIFILQNMFSFKEWVSKNTLSKVVEAYCKARSTNTYNLLLDEFDTTVGTCLPVKELEERMHSN